MAKPRWFSGACRPSTGERAFHSRFLVKVNGKLKTRCFDSGDYPESTLDDFELSGVSNAFPAFTGCATWPAAH